MKSYPLPLCHTILETIRAEHGSPDPESPDWRLVHAIRALFEILIRLPIEDVQIWGNRFSERQLAIFSDHLELANQPALRLRLAALFFYFRLADFERAVQNICYGRGEEDHLTGLKSWLDAKPSANKYLSGWVARFFEEKASRGRHHFVSTGLVSGDIHWKDFQRQAPLNNSSFYLEILDEAFERGHRVVIAKIDPEQANSRVVEYLASGEDQKVIHYLKFYPSEHMQMEAIQAIYEGWGAPDPRTQSRYKKLNMGELWGFREKLFRQKLPTLHLQEMRKVYWKNWIHHCTDVQVFKEGMRFSFGKLDVHEKQDFSDIIWAESEADSIKVNFGPNWQAKMDEILNEYLY